MGRPRENRRGGLLAYVLISTFANVGIDTLIEEFQGAEWSWLVAALIVTPFAQVPQAFSTMGATMVSIRFWPVLMLQYGVQFIALAVPVRRQGWLLRSASSSASACRERAPSRSG